MMKSDRQNSPFYWSTAFLRELSSHGSRHVVISPGSRSTPLVMAATSHPGMECHVVLDERSAAYIALGIGKATQTPAVLICTSGTAAANYFPAVIEARQSGIPMIVLTADRPPNLRNIGASQSIDQIKLFGDYPVFFHETGEPLMEKRDLDRLQQAAGQAFSLAKKRRGPAHINFPFRKPLEPDPVFVEQVKDENRSLGPVRPPGTATDELQGPGSLPERVRHLFEQAGRAVVIAGPQRHHVPGMDEAGELAALLNAPLLSEFPEYGNEHIVSGFDAFLKSARKRETLTPDLIVRFGQQPVGKGLHLYLEEHHQVPYIHFADLEEWHDVTGSVSHRVEWFGRQIDWNIETAPAESGWLNRWKEAEANYAALLEKEIGRQTVLTDGHVFHHLIRSIPEGWNLFLSNSFPVRDRMLFAGKRPLRTFVNRGASGIDGVISTAIGATLADDRPGILFIGDLAALHDSNALLSSKLLRRPLVVVLLNNGGGTIFRMLPVRRHEQVYEDFFETPQSVDFGTVASGYGIGHQRIATRDELHHTDLTKIDASGIRILECMTDPDASMDLRETLWNFSD